MNESINQSMKIREKEERRNGGPHLVAVDLHPSKQETRNNQQTTRQNERAREIRVIVAHDSKYPFVVSLSSSAVCHLIGRPLLRVFTCSCLTLSLFAYFIFCFVI